MNKNNTYDIILMDLQIPEMNGFETTEYIRKTMKYKIPIIALTADVTTVDVAKCKESGMDDYLSKPIGFYIPPQYLAVFYLFSSEKRHFFMRKR